MMHPPVCLGSEIKLVSDLLSATMTMQLPNTRVMDGC